jgi:ACS family hexuronate transporter-like MFS transporter
LALSAIAHSVAGDGGHHHQLYRAQFAGRPGAQLKADLAITTEQYSYIVGAFQLAYTLMQPIGGMLIDKIGLTAGFAIFALAWSLANMAHGAARGWMSLAAFRGLLGMAEAAAIPAGMKTIGEWFPDRERSVAVGWFNAGTSLGAVIAPVLAALVAKIMAGRRPLS